jgi:hypothetical protein
MPGNKYLSVRCRDSASLRICDEEGKSRSRRSEISKLLKSTDEVGLILKMLIFLFVRL